jgi:hypothetical protein
MKTYEQVVSQAPVFLNNWSGPEEVLRDFEENEAKHIGERILFASYGSEGYEGNAFVLFAQDGKLYEVNGNHCSCMGLETQWEPEETTIEALKMRLVDGTLGRESYCGNDFSGELKAFLGVEE